jgi:hypothetical protein
VQLRGTVFLPDGTPAVAANVLVESACDRLLKLVVTDEAGFFALSSFSPDCPDYKFNASLRRDMWLPTGRDVFYVRPNGTSPTIHLEPGVLPDPVIIRLEDRGGEAELRVRDEATGSYLKAGITLMRRGDERKVTGLCSFVIQPGEQGTVVLLPAGRYRVEVDRYQCGDGDISLARSPRTDFVVTAGEHHEVVVQLDTRTVKVRRSYNNPKASPCTP